MQKNDERIEKWKVLNQNNKVMLAKSKKRNLTKASK